MEGTVGSEAIDKPRNHTDKVIQASFPSSQIFLSGLADNMPGSNEFAEQGANPIWKVTQLKVISPFLI